MGEVYKINLDKILIVDFVYVNITSVDILMSFYRSSFFYTRWLGELLSDIIQCLSAT